MVLASGRMTRMVLAAALLGAAGVYAPGVWASPETDLAERLSAVGVQYNGSSAPDIPEMRAAFANAAVELSPADGRLLRQKLDAALRIADSASTIEALTALRKLEPQNTCFQAKQIEVYLGRLETVDAKLKYLSDIVNAESAPNDVRSFAATRAAWMYWEQSRSHPAWEMINKAIALNPINAEALRLQWVAGAASATPLQRMHLLLAMLRANPGQTDAAVRVAEELAGLGLLKPAADWFDYALTLSRQSGAALPRTLAADYAAVLYLSGRQPEGDEWLQRLLKADPSDPTAMFLLLAVTQTRQVQVATAVEEGLVQRLQMVRAAAGIAPPPTRPATEPVASQLPALDGDVAVFREDARNMRGAYLAALSDLAWFHIYFRHQPQAAEPGMQILRKLLPADSPMLARLDGWSFLAQDRLSEARVKLSAAASADPLAELGMIEIMKRNSAEREAAAAQARRLMEKQPAGVIGFIIQQRVADLKVKPEPTAAAEAVRDSVERFPLQLRRLATLPQEFYSIRVTAAQVEHEFSQPLMLTVTIRNISDQPLTMGENGILRDIWFDVQLRGGLDRFLPGAAYAPLTGPLVLAPRASYSQVVRLDLGVLGRLFEDLPSTPLQLSVGAVVNAVPGEMGISPGIYGYRSRMDQLLVRTGMPLWTEAQVQGALSILEGGEPAKRLRVIDAVAAYLGLSQEKSEQPLTPALGDAWRLLLDKGTRDTSPLLQTWALYRKAALTGGAGGSLEQLADSPAVYARLLAVAAARTASADRRISILGKLANDEDAGVRRAATAIQALPEAPATAPATAPLQLREMDVH